MPRDPFEDFAETRVLRVEPMLNSLRREIRRKVRQFGEEWKQRGAVIMNEWCFRCVAASLEAAEAEMLERSGEPVVPWPSTPSFIPLYGLNVFSSPDIRRPFELVEQAEA